MLPNNDKGFIVADTLLALSCFLLITGMILPFITKLQAEQYNLLRQQDAYDVMQQLKTTEHSATALAETVIVNNYEYKITTALHENHQLICVEWVRANEISENYCQYRLLL